MLTLLTLGVWLVSSVIAQPSYDHRFANGIYAPGLLSLFSAASLGGCIAGLPEDVTGDGSFGRLVDDMEGGCYGASESWMWQFGVTLLGAVPATRVVAAAATALISASTFERLPFRSLPANFLAARNLDFWVAPFGINDGASHAAGAASSIMLKIALLIAVPFLTSRTKVGNLGLLSGHHVTACQGPKPPLNCYQGSRPELLASGSFVHSIHRFYRRGGGVILRGSAKRRSR
jgi:hypothetical protein